MPNAFTDESHRLDVSFLFRFPLGLAQVGYVQALELFEVSSALCRLGTYVP